MKTVLTDLKAWFQSKGGFAHVVYAAFAVLLLAYDQVPQFQQLCLDVYTWLPGRVEELLLAAIAFYAWYRNNNVEAEGETSAHPVFTGGAPKMLLVAALVPALLIGTLPTVACTQTQYQEVVGYVNEFLPVAEAVANIILATAAPADVPTAQGIENQINTDFQLIETTASEITSQNYSDKRATILALAADVQKNLSAYLTAVHVSDPASVAKVQAYVALGEAVISEIVNAFPATATDAAFPKIIGIYNTKAEADAARIQNAALQKKLGNVRLNYKREFNRITAARTGSPKVDAVLAHTHKFIVLGWSGWHPTIH